MPIMRAHVFLFKQILFSVGAWWYAGMQPGSHKNLSLIKTAEKQPNVSWPLNHNQRVLRKDTKSPVELYLSLGLLSRQQICNIFLVFLFFCFFFPENRIWYFMQFVLQRDNWHEMSKPIFRKMIKIFKNSSVALKNQLDKR